MSTAAGPGRAPVPGRSTASGIDLAHADFSDVNRITAENDRTPKRQAILDAATRIFLDAGYGAASMDAIAHAAGVSKQTIYNNFGSKETLFGAIISRWCERLLTPFLTAEVKAQGVENALLFLGRQFNGLILAPESLALYRVLVAEVDRFPELGRISYTSGAAAAVESLAAYLSEETAKGVLHVNDPHLAAEQFFGMLCGHTQLRALLCVDVSPSPEELERATSTAVETFMRMYARPR